MLQNKKLACALALAIWATQASAQNVLIEERSLSGSTPTPPRATPVAQVAPAIESKPLAENTGAAAGDNNDANPKWELYQQVQQLQDEVQSLRGTVEEQSHLIEKMRNDQRTRYTDLDQRINSLNEKFIQLQQVPAPSPAVANVPTTAIEVPATANIEEEKKAYLAAYDVFRAQGPDKAIPPMLTFVRRYPASTFAPNAYYWLGEFYLAATPADPANAKRNFETVLAKFPDHAKAPAAIYKLGSIADLQGKPDEAKKRMQELLSRFPSSPEAALAQAYLKPPSPEPKPEAKPAAPKAPAKPAPAKPAPKKKP